MAPILSLLTQQLVEKLFDPGDQAEAARLLVEECGNNLPFCGESDEYKLERIRFAAMRLSIGYLEDLPQAITSAKNDWRDVPVWAGFGESLTAHQKWAEQALKENAKPMVIILMGLAGSGKTTMGSLLARTLGWMYYETDNFLSTADFNKAVRGEPLTDETVETWLGKVRLRVSKYVAKKQNAVFACSALKESYRQILRVSPAVRFVYLHGSYEQIEEQQKQRKSQLPHLERLAYEYKILEEPHDALTLDISQSPEDIIASIRTELGI